MFGNLVLNILQFMLASGKGYNIYGLTLTASTLAPLQGFWNFIVYAKPRYFNANGWEMLRLSLQSTYKIFTRHRSTDSHGVRKNEPQALPDVNVSNPIKTLNDIKTESPFKNHRSVMETEVVPFGAPDLDHLPSEVLGSNDELEKQGTAPPRRRWTLIALPRRLTRMNNENIVAKPHSAPAGLTGSINPIQIQQEIIVDECPESNEDDDMYDMMIAG
jgi:hypothetical protein